MAYSKSPVTLMRRRSYVEPMFRGENCAWTAPFPHGADASGWAYKVRECLNVAKRNPKRFPELAQYADAYKVEVLSETLVQASVEANGNVVEGTAVVASEYRPAQPSGITSPEARTRYEIVQMVLQRGNGNGPFHFPNAALGHADLSKLSAWAATQNLFVLKPQGAGITLVKADDSIPENARIVP